MRPESSSVRSAARPVAGVLLVVLAVLLAFSSMITSGASAEPGATDTPTSNDTATADETSTGGEATDDPSDPPSEDPTTVQVEGAVFRWGINNQTNAHSHNPMPEAFNFMSAGVADPGRGGITLPRSKWRARSGNVAIQKWGGSRWRTATWAGLNRSPSGQKINSSSIFSAHNVVIGRGTGEVDVARGTARITWDGTFTVLYYGGNTMFTVSDPVLSVDEGNGVVTAELGGYATSRDNGGWMKVPAKRVTIATLDNVDLSPKNGFSVTPRYLGVTTSGSATQDRSGESAGSFPQQMISFLSDMEVDQFWYSTGLSTDDTKVASLLTVSYDEASEVTPTPTPEPSSEPTIDNPVNEAPAQPGAPAPQQEAPALTPADQAPGLPDEVPEEQRQLLTPADLGEVRPVAGEISSSEAPTRTWWLVGALLLVAALLLLVPARPRG